jgi:hypothetical protein
MSSNPLSRLLGFGVIRQTRRNHAFEHATAHFLARKVRNLRVSGISAPFGFVLLHNGKAEHGEAAAAEALEALKAGKRQFALHPNCGTNLVTAGLLTTLVGWLFLGGRRASYRNFNRALPLMMLAVYFSQPLGMKVQEHVTTDGDVGEMEIAAIRTDSVKMPLWGKQFNVLMVYTKKA